MQVSLVCFAACLLSLLDLFHRVEALLAEKGKTSAALSNASSIYKQNYKWLFPKKGRSKSMGTGEKIDVIARYNELMYGKSINSQMAAPIPQKRSKTVEKKVSKPTIESVPERLFKLSIPEERLMPEKKVLPPVRFDVERRKISMRPPLDTGLRYA